MKPYLAPQRNFRAEQDRIALLARRLRRILGIAAPAIPSRILTAVSLWALRGSSAFTELVAALGPVEKVLGQLGYDLLVRGRAVSGSRGSLTIFGTVA